MFGALRLGLGLTRAKGGGVSTAQIVALFGAGEPGVIIDPLDQSSVFSSSAGSGAITENGGALGYIADKSPNAKHMTQATGSRRPSYKRSTREIVFGGFTQGLATGSINFTGTGVITVVMAVRKRRDKHVGVLVELSPNVVNNNGAFYVSSSNDNSERGYGFALRGSSSAIAVVRALGLPIAPTQDVIAVKFDLLGATLADRIVAEVNDVAPALTTLLTLNGGAGTVFGNWALQLGSRTSAGNPTRVNTGRVMVIGRALTETEMALAKRWCREGQPTMPSTRLIAVGDSTIAAFDGNMDVPAFIRGAEGWQIAVPAETIAQQRTRWNAIADSTAYASDAVVVQIGLNDLDPAESAATALARLQLLIDDINADKLGDMQVLISQMLPCRARLITLYGGTNGPIAYQKWLDMNDAIAGNGGNAITGVDGRITAHVALLNDGAGNLAAAYDTGDGIHENNAGRRIIAQAWIDGLSAVGVTGLTLEPA